MARRRRRPLERDRPHSETTAAPAWVILCFFSTGATALVYETSWARLLELHFGSTQYAVSTVLSVFMLGLGLGSGLGGRIADRVSRPLRLFGALEIAIGIYCLATPALFDWMGGVATSRLRPSDLAHAAFQLEHFLLAAAVLLPPTLMAGATLPLVVRGVATSGARLGFDFSRLYAVNTFGGVVGCAVAGFAALRWLGITGTLTATGVLDVVIGAGVILLARAAPAAVRPVAERDRRAKAARTPAIPGRLRTLVLVVATGSGFAALACEVLWFRVLTLVLGSSVYAFTVMLCTFLTGLALGSELLAPRLLRRGSAVRSLAALQMVLAFSILAAIPLFSRLPDVFLSLFAAVGTDFWALTLLQSSIPFALMFVPTVCLGASLPIAAHLRVSRPETLGREVGDLYLANTLGSIGGALVAGFVLQPAIGIQASIVVVAALSASLGCALLVQPEQGRSTKRSPWRAALVALAFAVCVVLVPGWDARRMTLGPYVNQAAINPFLRSYRQGEATDELLYYREGVHAVISVRRASDGSWIAYQANGKWEGSVGDNAPSWSLLGHVPMLLHPKPSRALLVGLGTGVSLGAMLDYPVEQVDVVEIEPAVVEAASYFSEAHDDALSDPRVRLFQADGRSFLAVGEASYDVIVSGVSDPWISGASSLFTREYFARVADRLADGGVAAIWMQNYRITPDELKIALRTVTDVFEDVSVWAPHDEPTDLVLICSKRPIAIDAERLFDRLASHSDPASLKRAGIETIFHFLNLRLVGGADLLRFVGDGPLHTDDRPVLEFSLPRHLYTDPHAGVEERAASLVGAARGAVPPLVLPEPLRAGFYYGLASVYSHYAYREPHAVALFRRVLELDPGNAPARAYLEAKGAVESR